MNDESNAANTVAIPTVVGTVDTSSVPTIVTTKTAGSVIPATSTTPSSSSSSSSQQQQQQLLFNIPPLPSSSSKRKQQQQQRASIASSETTPTTTMITMNDEKKEEVEDANIVQEINESPTENNNNNVLLGTTNNKESKATAIVSRPTLADNKVDNDEEEQRTTVTEIGNTSKEEKDSKELEPPSPPSHVDPNNINEKDNSSGNSTKMKTKNRTVDPEQLQQEERHQEPLEHVEENSRQLQQKRRDLFLSIHKEIKTKDTTTTSTTTTTTGRTIRRNSSNRMLPVTQKRTVTTEASEVVDVDNETDTVAQEPELNNNNKNKRGRGRPNGNLPRKHPVKSTISNSNSGNGSANSDPNNQPIKKKHRRAIDESIVATTTTTNSDTGYTITQEDVLAFRNRQEQTTDDVNNDATTANIDTKEQTKLLLLKAYELFYRDYYRAYARASTAAAANGDEDMDHINTMILEEWNQMSHDKKIPYLHRSKSSSSSSSTNSTGITTTTTSHQTKIPVVASKEEEEEEGAELHLSGTGSRNSGNGVGKRLPTTVSKELTKTTSSTTNQNGKQNTVQDSNDDNSNDEDNDSNRRWYATLESTPTSTTNDAGITTSTVITKNHDRPLFSQQQNKTTANGTLNNGTINNGVQRQEKAQTQKQSILNPKRPPKINMNGSYRKPGGPQPVGYVWNANFGYWELDTTASTSTANNHGSSMNENGVHSTTQRSFRFDDDKNANDGRHTAVESMSIQHRHSIGGTANPAARKRTYTADGCIVPKQTLERLKDGTYVRPMGRPIVGYDWDPIRGVWVPVTSLASSSAAYEVIRKQQQKQQQRNSYVASINRKRKYTSDGCILPAKTPMLADDETYIRPFGRSIVGYYWNKYRGVWAPIGGATAASGRTKNTTTRAVGSSIIGSKSRDRKDEMVVGPRRCEKCAACLRALNCNTCLHCKIEQHQQQYPPAISVPSSPYLTCCLRICTEPIITEHTDQSNDDRESDDNNNNESDDDDGDDENNEEQHHENEEDDDIDDDDDSFDESNNNETEMYDNVANTTHAGGDDDDNDNDDDGSLMESFVDEEEDNVEEENVAMDAEMEDD